MMRNDVAEKGKFLCPICNDMVDCKGNISLFNKHVDKCLSKDETANPQAQNAMEDEGNNQDEVRSAPPRTNKKGKSKKAGDGTLTGFISKK